MEARLPAVGDLCITFVIPALAGIKDLPRSWERPSPPTISRKERVVSHRFPVAVGVAQFRLPASDLE